MTPDFSNTLDLALQHLKQELDSLRTGRANPVLVENIMVDAYGAQMPLQQVASIHAPEPRLIVIQPWDATLLKEIEKSLTMSNVGITPVVDGKNIRLPFPPMTEERRRDMVKVVHEKAEAARIRLRALREEQMKKLKKDEEAGDISEDEATRQRSEIQKAVDHSVTQVESLVKAKEAEVMTV